MRTKRNPPLIAVARQLVDDAFAAAFRRMLEIAAERRARSTHQVMDAFSQAMHEQLVWRVRSKRVR